jgi:bifunctional DNA-binding transcriptional regulator/antitoxin component of YhaV-PrlF toxin-antitoxin module
MNKIMDTLTKEYNVNIQERGVVTIPAPIRKILGASKITFVVYKEDIKIKPQKLSVDSLSGKYSSLSKGKNIDNIIKDAKREHAEKRNII